MRQLRPPRDPHRALGQGVLKPGRGAPELAAAVLERIRADGALVQSHAEAESLVSLVTGQRLRSSWWSHPESHLIHAVEGLVGADPDVTVLKLMSGRTTYVHRNLWPAVVAVGSAREPWQLDGLDAAAVRLLRAVDEAGEARTDTLAAAWDLAAGALGASTRELERGLLLHTREVHTEAGYHAKRLTSWAQWGEAVGLPAALPPPAAAKNELHRILGRINATSHARLRLPWPKSTR